TLRCCRATPHTLCSRSTAFSNRGKSSRSNILLHVVRVRSLPAPPKFVCASCKHVVSLRRFHLSPFPFPSPHSRWQRRTFHPSVDLPGGSNVDAKCTPSSNKCPRK